MINLIKFFLPKSLQLTLMYFGIGLAACIVLHFIPIGKESREILQFLIMTLGFPGVAYFNSKSYLYYSLHWVLLTPVHKLHIVFVNGLNNLSKLISIILLYMIYYQVRGLVYEKSSSEVFSFSDLTWDVESFLAYFIVLVAGGGFLFFMMPNLTDRVQNARDYKVSQSLFKNKRFIWIILSLFATVFVLSDNIVNMSPYLSEFFIIPGAVYLILLAGVILTMQSVKYYYSKKVVFSVIGAAFLLTSAFTYYQASKDFSKRSNSINVRLSGLDMIIPYDNGLLIQMMDELKQAPQDHKHMVSGALRDVVLLNTSASDELIASYFKLCNERKDFTCRLYTYLTKSKLIEKDFSLKLVAACANDVGSCVIAFKRGILPKEQLDVVYAALMIRCEASLDSTDKKYCVEFKSYKSASKVNAKSKP